MNKQIQFTTELPGAGRRPNHGSLQPVLYIYVRVVCAIYSDIHTHIGQRLSSLGLWPAYVKHFLARPGDIEIQRPLVLEACSFVGICVSELGIQQQRKSLSPVRVCEPSRTPMRKAPHNNLQCRRMNVNCWHHCVAPFWPKLHIEQSLATCLQWLTSLCWAILDKSAFIAVINHMYAIMGTMGARCLLTYWMPSYCLPTETQFAYTQTRKNISVSRLVAPRQAALAVSPFRSG